MEINKIENKETKKPQVGTWDKMMSSAERKEKIRFEFDSPITVTLNCSKPKEIEWDDAVFYIFDVFHNGEERVISTSAWSLLRGLNELGDFNGKKIMITKKMINGKQQYFVQELKGDTKGNAKGDAEQVENNDDGYSY